MDGQKGKITEAGMEQMGNRNGPTRTRTTQIDAKGCDFHPVLDGCERFA